MRSVLVAAILCALTLAACGTPAVTPTATVVPPTLTPSPVVMEENDPIATLAATLGAPIPGTLVVPDHFGTPQPALSFDDLIFTRSGGIAGGQLMIQLTSDGTLTRDGVTSKVTPEQVQQIATLLDGVQFYDLQGVFTGPASADAYHYTLTVNGEGRGRTVASQDGLTPPQLLQLYDAIRTLSEQPAS